MSIHTLLHYCFVNFVILIFSVLFSSLFSSLGKVPPVRVRCGRWSIRKMVLWSRQRRPTAVFDFGMPECATTIGTTAIHWWVWLIRKQPTCTICVLRNEICWWRRGVSKRKGQCCDWSKLRMSWKLKNSRQWNLETSLLFYFSELDKEFAFLFIYVAPHTVCPPLVTFWFSSCVVSLSCPAVPWVCWRL